MMETNNLISFSTLYYNYLLKGELLLNGLPLLDDLLWKALSLLLSDLPLLGDLLWKALSLSSDDLLLKDV
jgi:hypothetical protein